MSSKHPGASFRELPRVSSRESFSCEKSLGCFNETVGNDLCFMMNDETVAELETGSRINARQTFSAIARAPGDLRSPAWHPGLKAGEAGT